MKIVVNTNKEDINGFIGNEPFSILYDESAYKSLMNLSSQVESATSVAQVKILLEQATALVNANNLAIEASKCPYLFLDKTTGEYFLKNKDVISKIAMPQVLVDRIFQAMDKGLDYMPVIKMWSRLLRNKKVIFEYNQDFIERFSNYLDIQVLNTDLYEKLMNEKGYSKERAVAASKQHSIQITKEGMLLTYKVSSELLTKWILDKDNNPVEVPRFDKGTPTIDENSGLLKYPEPKEIASEDRTFEPVVQGKNGDAFYCSPIGVKGELGHIIKVGAVISLPDWSYVNTDDSVSCRPGLHIGGIDYIRGYQNSNTQTHNIVVDPMDIGAIPDDSTGAMRVLRYYVLDVFNGVNNSIYHTSDYAAFTDSEFSKFVDETLKLEQEHIDAIVKAKAETKAQINDLV